MNPISSHRATPKTRSSASFPAHIADELRRYDEHLRDVRGLAASTRKDQRHRLARRHRNATWYQVTTAGRTALADGNRAGAGGLSPERETAYRQAIHLLDTDVDLKHGMLTIRQRALARLHEPDVKIQRYRAPDSLLDFLKTL